MSDAETFLSAWSKIWVGQESSAELYMSLLHEGCPLINPLSPITREDLPQFMETVLGVEPDIRVMPGRWAETSDGSVIFEWTNTGTLNGSPIEVRGVDRYTLRDGKAVEGYSYFDPRPFVEAPKNDS